MSNDHVVNFGSFGPGYFANMIYTSPAHPSGNSSRTDLNFRCGADIPLHLNARYDERALVLNTMANQQWQHEERPPGFPLGLGQSTQITAVATDQSIDVFANKRQFCHSYRHRYDVNKVNQVQFWGRDTAVKPWVGKALPNFEVGKVVYIKGQAPTENGFNVDFVPSLPHDYKTENFAMHLSFRFKENCVVRNHKTNEKWGQEERAGGMPIQPGQAFSLTFVAQKGGFEVGVNGSHFCHFRYRVPLTKDMSVETIRLPFIEKIEYY